MAYYYIQHADYVAAGSLTPWAVSRELELNPIKLYEEEYNLPPIEEVDGLIILGGPMNIYEEEKYPFLKDSKQLICQTIEAKVKTLGICLGGQLISHVLGAKVYPNDYKEIGWHTVKLQQEGVFHDFENPTSFFHWHGDIFELPKEVKLLAESAISPHQAYSYQQHVLALQFHPEVTEELIQKFLRDSETKTEVGQGAYAQSAEKILQRTKKEAPLNQERFWKILDRFFL